MNNILEDLWYGNISPAEHSFAQDSEYAHLLLLVEQNSKKLNATLNPEEKVTFVNFKECSLELSELEERAAFNKGFSLGVRLMLAALSNDSSM